MLRVGQAAPAIGAVTSPSKPPSPCSSGGERRVCCMQATHCMALNHCIARHSHTCRQPHHRRMQDRHSDASVGRQPPHLPARPCAGIPKVMHNIEFSKPRKRSTAGAHAHHRLRGACSPPTRWHRRNVMQAAQAQRKQARKARPSPPAGIPQHRR